MAKENLSPKSHTLHRSQGNSGGIIAIWDNSMFKGNRVIHNEEGFLAIFGEWLHIGMVCLMIVVYAPQDGNKKCCLWNRLLHLIHDFHDMVIVLGDFNEVRSECERSGSLFCKKGAKLFNEFISKADLVDLPMGGRKFTRMDKHGTKLSKIDRILMSHHFTSKWPNAQLTALPRDLSDHCPLVLKSHSEDYGPIPFKFFNSWLLNEDFPHIVSESWSSHHDSITLQHPANVVKKKLQTLKHRLKNWRNNVCSKNDTLIRNLKTKVDILECKAEASALSSLEIEERLSLIKHLEDAEHIKRLDLMQKAKIKWAIEGDENSKYFHGIINNKFARFRINGIYIDGVWVTNPPQVTDSIFNFHKVKFQGTSFNRPHFTSNLFKKLSRDEVSILDAPFTTAEIKNAVWDCGGGKAPGPDGFTFKFIKQYWDTIGKDFTEIAYKFEADGYIPRGCNS
ncbi:putative RNA-directed DNA polymerase, partial [Tanacetum coccineum]